jgi:pyrroloquinoline quinone biosynthesis protein E
MPAPRPYTLIAELTYQCPLRCTYCSNPVDFGAYRASLSTEEWCKVLDGANALGVLQVHFTGGEPLLRKDLEELVAKARGLGLYTNLITSGVPLTRERLVALREAGVDNVQLSLQHVSKDGAELVCGVDHHDHKLEVARWVKELDLPLTINVVLHRGNLDGVPAIIEYAEAAKADRLELANTQYQGWALENRAHLMPTREQIEAGAAVADLAKKRLEGTMEVLYVKPDYFGRYPRACMDGWGRRFITMTPDGKVLPCHAAHVIDSLTFESVKDRPLEAIWEDSPALVAFRGDAWMPEPCRSCERKAIDFGGCRCQAFQLTGDAARTDPACSLSPDHAKVAAAREAGRDPAPRPGPNYRKVRLPLGPVG